MEIKLMSHQSIVKVRVELALVTSSLVIMVTVFHVSISAMEIMIVWITVMKMPDMNAVSTFNYLPLLL